MEPNTTDAPVYAPDDKGRPHVKSMTDRELLEENTVILRATQDLVEKFISDFAKNPALGMLGKMFGGK